MSLEFDIAQVARRSQLALVGLPGVGKSAVAKRLAQATGVTAIDADDEIARLAGHSISEIFADTGEQGFRRREREAVSSLLDGLPKILALGGGAFEDQGSREALLRSCAVAWLDVPDALILERLGGGKDRPLFAAGRPEQVLSELRRARTANYMQAHWHISGTDSDQIAGKLAALWKPDIPPRSRRGASP